MINQSEGGDRVCVGKSLSEEVLVELRMLGAWRMEEELEARHSGGKNKWVAIFQPPIPRGP